MKTVAGSKYLFIRNKVFYFRYKLPKSFYRKDIRVSLKTRGLSEAMKKVEILSPHISALRTLSLSHLGSDRLTIEQAVQAQIIGMKQKLDKYSVERIIRLEEQSFKEQLDKIVAETRIDLNANEQQSDLSHNITLRTRNEFYELAQKYDSLTEMIEKEDFTDKPDLFGLVIACTKLATLTATRSLKDIYQDRNLDIEVRQMAWQRFKSKEEQELEYRSDVEGDPFIFRTKPNLGVSSLEIDRLADEYGYSSPETKAEYQYFHEKLLRSRQLLREFVEAIFNRDITKLRQIERLTERNFHPNQSTNYSGPASSDGKLFSEVYREFLAVKVEKEKLSVKIQKDYERYHEVWNLLSQDKPIKQYEPKDIGIFVDQCFDLPQMNKSPYNKMTMPERVAADVPEEKRIAPKSVQGYYKWLQSVFAFAARDTIGYIKQSPCNIKRDFTQNKRGPFTNSELKSFVDYALWEKVCWKKWCLLLAIYTGARRGELFQIRTEDVKVDADSGLHYILITDEHESQKVKTDNARRRIPLHPKLIEFGFLNFVVQTEGRLLDGVGNRNSITAWFGRVMAKLDIEPENELSHTRSFHSLRHSFITKIRNESPSLDLHLLQQVVGHELSKGGITDNYTHSTAPIGKLYEVIKGFEV
mgnify:CR=1 FL=1